VLAVALNYVERGCGVNLLNVGSVFHDSKNCRLTAEAPFPRYLNRYDIYGLGVVLLELGLWRPIGRFENRLAALAPEERRRNLVEIAVDLDITMGPKYRSVVQWCLQLDGGEILGDTMFISMVLNKLDELEDVVSL